MDSKTEESVNTEAGKEAIAVDKNESGFEDLSACSPDSNMSNNQSSISPVSAVTPLDKTRNNHRTQQDDSGILSSEKSLTDGDISEITNNNIEDTVTDKILNSNNHLAKDKTKKNNASIDEVSCDVSAADDEDDMLSEKINSKCDDDNDDNNKRDGDAKDNDDAEDEDFAEFVKHASKSRSHVRALVDYGNTSSDKDSDDEMPNNEKTKRNYRKKRQDSDDDSDNDLDELQVETSDADNDSGEPMFIRSLRLPDGANIMRLSDSDSDSSDEEEDIEDKVKHDTSESEADDTPVDVSKFGPVKQNWKAAFDLRNRELGGLPKKQTGSFTTRVQGSLQMVQRLELQYKMDKHQGCVNALNFNSDGTLLASGSDDLNVVIWDWARNRPSLVYFSGHRSNVFQTKFMPFSGDCHVVSCARDGQVRLADLSTTGVCKGTKKLAQHRGAAHKLAIENDSPHIVLSAGEDAVTYQIDLREDKPTKLVTTKENDKKVSMYSIHSNPSNSNEFCLGGRDHFIRVYDKRNINEEVDDGIVKKYSPDHIESIENNSMKANVTCACYNYNGTEILGTYNDEDIYLFDNRHSDSANFTHRFKGHRNNQTVKGVNFYGAHSEYIVSGSDCGHIYLWDKSTENIVQLMKGDEGGVVNVLEPHPTVPILATSGLDHDVKIWSPTAQHCTKLKGLRKLTERNLKEREDVRSGEAGMIANSMLWYVMHHLRQSRHRRAREARANRRDHDDDDDSSDTLSDEDLSTDEESDTDDAPRDEITCNSS